MTDPVLNQNVGNPQVSPVGPNASDGYSDRQARGVFGGPAFEAAKAALEAQIAKELANIAERRLALAADARISTMTAGGVDETPGLGEVVMGGEAVYGIYQGVQLARALARLKRLYDALKALQAANVQVQGRTRRQRDCGSGPTS